MIDTDNKIIRNPAFWRARYDALNSVNGRLIQQTYSEAERAFELAQRDIRRDIDAWLNRFAGDDGISLAEARRLLSAGELKDFKRDIAEYIKRGRDNAISGKWIKELENASARRHFSRLEALKIRTQNHLENAFAAENKAVENLVKNVYESNFYHTCFELQKGFGIGFDISGIDERQLDVIAKKPWTVDRRTFSDRIWERRDKMVSALHQEMIRNCIYGRSRDEMSAALDNFVGKDIKNAEYCAARVIKTEASYFASQSQRQALSDLGCEMYEVYLPLSSKSCEVCREMNGKRFKLSEYVVGSTAPPFHPNCVDGSIIPYDEDGFAVDGTSIPDDLTYEEWESRFVREEGTENMVDYMSSSFRPQYSNNEITLTVGDISIQTKLVKNSQFNLLTDISESRRSKAVRLTEKQLQAVSDLLPDSFDIPTTAVVNFEKYGLNPNAIAGYERVSGIMFINNKYDTVEKILNYVNKQAGQFANKTEFAPILHELGHNFYENSVNALAKSKGLEYNRAKGIIDGKIYDYIHTCGSDDFFKNTSLYAQNGFKNNHYTEVVAECFSVVGVNEYANKLIELLKEVI